MQFTLKSISRVKNFGILFFAYLFASSSYAIEIGDGDVYQQPTSSSYAIDDLTLLPGGTIIERADGHPTWFLSGSSYEISGGLVDTRLTLDNAPVVSISGGLFNGVYNIIDRIYGDIHISGGLFQNIVEICRYTGNVVISGGFFNNFLRVSFSTTGGATPTFTLMGYNWKVDGVPVDFPTDTVEISSYVGGTLTGNLSDGNEFSRLIDTRIAPVGGLFLVSTPNVPNLSCEGFFSPFDAPKTINKKAKGTIPVKMELIDELWQAVLGGDLVAPPVINVMFDGQTYGDGSTDDVALESVGSANDGNEFTFNDAEQIWQYNLGTKQFSGSGTYIVTVKSGDQNEYTISPTCTQVFTRKD